MCARGFAALLQFKVQAGTRSLELPARLLLEGHSLGRAHTVFKTLGEACDFIFKPRFLRVASAQSWLLIVQPVFVLNPLTKARLASLVAGSACDWGTVFTSVPHCVLISPARVQASTCHSLLDPRTDCEAGLSPTGPVFL